MVRDGLVGAIDALATFAAPLPGPPLPGLHPLPARATGDGRQAGDALVLRAGARPPRRRAAAGRPPVPRREGDDRHPGQLPGPLRRRSRQGRGARPDGRRGVRLRRLAPGLGPDLHPQGRLAGRRGPRRRGRERPPVRLGPPPAGPRARGRGAVRGRADRLVGDGLQAEPDAGRADVLDRPVRDGPPRRRLARPPRPSGWNGPWTTARSGGWSCPRRSWPSTPC